MKNKTALITGAAKRIGAAIAKHLHKSGMDIIVHHHTSAKEADELVNSLNATRTDSAITLQANLEQQESYDALVKEALLFKGKIDVLINNASVFYPTNIEDMNETNWNELINVNLKAPLFLSQSAVNSLRETKGCIVNIADIHGDKPLKDHPIYSISKSGLIMLTQSLAKELAPDVRVNAVSPGAITWPEEMGSKTKELILEQCALKRTGTMEDICKAVFFLINDADYITGQVLKVDGGRTL